MRVFALSSFAWTMLVACASAQPSPEEACAFFLPSVTVSEINGGRLDPPAFVFTRTSTDLERYTLFVSDEVIVEKSAPRDDGSIILFGKASAIATCFIDEVDRRVLEVAIRPGPSVGEIVSDQRHPRGEVKIKPVDPKVELTGNAVHRGYY